MKVFSWTDICKKDFSLYDALCKEQQPFFDSVYDPETDSAQETAWATIPSLAHNTDSARETACTAIPDLVRDSDSGAALTIGGFDGPHSGHYALLNAVLSQPNLLHGVVTFLHPPRALKETDSFKGEVSTIRLRLERFSRYGFDFVLLIDFSQDFGRIEGRVFLDVLYTACRMRFIAVGEDFRCGYKLDTGKTELEHYAKQKGITLSVHNDVLINGERVSSSLVRQAVSLGDFNRAQKLLGYPYRLDCSLLSQTESDNTVTIKKPELGFKQIMPPVGQYDVCIQTAPDSSCQDEQSRSFCTKLYVESDFLRCRLSQNDFGKKVQTIVFNGNN